MIKSNQPLLSYVEEFRDAGVDLGVFPTQRGDRFALRLVDPDDRATGLTFVASFSSKLGEADIPKDKAKAVKASKALDDMLNDSAKMAKYVACFCVIDQKSLDEFPDKYTEEDLGRTFTVIAAAGTAKSLTYGTAEVEETESESKKSSARSISRSRR